MVDESRVHQCEIRLDNCEHDLYYTKRNFQDAIKNCVHVSLVDQVFSEINHLACPTSEDALRLMQEYKMKAKMAKQRLQKQQEEKERQKNKYLRGLIKRVEQNKPWTIVWWSDGTITRVKKAKGDKWDPEKGLLCAIAKHFYQDTNVHNDMLRKWCGE